MTMMTKPTTAAALIWTGILATSAVVGTWAFACVFPFAAIATIAALTLDARRGLAVVGATWAANQIVGFAVVDYPRTLETVALGVSLGLGALAAFAVARTVLRPTTPVRVPLALGGAFVAYQLVIYAGALGFGGAGNFGADIVAAVALNDLIWFAALALLWTVLGRTGTLRTQPLRA
jgi:hypothetical protein